MQHPTMAHNRTPWPAILNSHLHHRPSLTADT